MGGLVCSRGRRRGQPPRLFPLSLCLGTTRDSLELAPRDCRGLRLSLRTRKGGRVGGAGKRERRLAQVRECERRNKKRRGGVSCLALPWAPPQPKLLIGQAPSAILVQQPKAWACPKMCLLPEPQQEESILMPLSGICVGQAQGA